MAAATVVALRAEVPVEAEPREARGVARPEVAQQAEAQAVDRPVALEEASAVVASEVEPAEARRIPPSRRSRSPS